MISAPNYRASGALRMAIWFAAGFLAVPIFNQMMLALLFGAGIAGSPPFPMAATPPLGVPAVVSLAFWGGVWGLVMAAVERRFPRGAGYWLAALLFGAIFPTLVAWFVVFPLKGRPAGGGWQAAGIATGLLVNGAWGIGTALIATWVARLTARSSRARARG